VALLIFDEAELVPLPLEWSQDKEHYVLLQLKELHYSAVRLVTDDDKELLLLLDHDTVTRAIE
jgi:urease accessory protein UreE